MAPDAVIPLRQTTHGDVESQWSSCQALAHTYLQIEGNALKIVVVGFHLSTQVTGYGREAPLVLLVVEVQSEINAHGQRVIACDMRRDELCRDTTAELVGEGVGKRTSHGDVTRREVAQILVVGCGLLHRAVVHILGNRSPRAAIASPFHKGGTGRLRSLHEGHEVQVDGLVAHAVDECRVVEDQSGIVVSECDVVASHGSHMRTDRQSQEVIGRLTLLGDRRER